MTIPDRSTEPGAGGAHQPPPRQPMRRPLVNDALIRVYRQLPGLIVGMLIGVLATIVWQVFAVGGGDDKFAPAPQPSTPDVVVTLSYALIAALIEQEIDRGQINLPLRDIRADNTDGHLRLRGTVEVLRQNVSATVELEPHIEEGRLVAQVRSAKFGRLPVPSNLQRLAEDPLNRELTAVIANLPAGLTSVRVTDAGLVVTADVRIEELPAFEQK